MINIDLQGLLLRGDPRWNILLQPGDVVNVPPAGFVHVTGGGVEKPGTYELADKNLLQLIDEAGGLKFEARRTLNVVRFDDQHRRQVYDVNYDDLLAKKTTDIALKNQDRIVVDTDPSKVVIGAVGRAMKNVFRFVIGGYIDLFGSESGRGY
ncbi:MAG: hypothetical protein M1457_11400, partial [bacterium]|nr:hypothetical protein [bacterium]